MYGLFRISYDYYKFEDLVCISDEKNKLKKYYKTISPSSPLLKRKESNLITDLGTEKEHYVILKIKQV